MLLWIHFALSDSYCDFRHKISHIKNHQQRHHKCCKAFECIIFLVHSSILLLQAGRLSFPCLVLNDSSPRIKRPCRAVTACQI